MQVFVFLLTDILTQPIDHQLIEFMVRIFGGTLQELSLSLWFRLHSLEEVYFGVQAIFVGRVLTAFEWRQYGIPIGRVSLEVSWICGTLLSDLSCLQPFILEHFLKRIYPLFNLSVNSKDQTFSGLVELVSIVYVVF